MKKHTMGIVIVTAFAGGLLLGMTDAGGAGKSMGISRGRHAEQTFTANGLVSGPLSGLVLVGDQSVEIVESTKIFHIGGGEMESGAVVNSASVLVSGVVRNKKPVAIMVVVGEPQSNKDFSDQTLSNVEKDPNAAR